MPSSLLIPRIRAIACVLMVVMHAQAADPGLTAADIALILAGRSATFDTVSIASELRFSTNASVDMEKTMVALKQGGLTVFESGEELARGAITWRKAGANESFMWKAEEIRRGGVILPTTHIAYRTIVWARAGNEWTFLLPNSARITDHDEEIGNQYSQRDLADFLLLKYRHLDFARIADCWDSANIKIGHGDWAGVSGLKLEVPVKYGSGRAAVELVLSQQHGYSPVRFRMVREAVGGPASADGSEVEIIHENLEQIEGRWIPRRIVLRYSTRSSNASIKPFQKEVTVDLKSVVFDKPIDPADLKITIPKGIPIYDTIRGDSWFQP